MGFFGKRTKQDWLKAAEKLGLVLTSPNKGTSHTAVRKPDVAPDDIRGLIVTIYEGMSKQVNGKVFREFQRNGFEEDAIWKALGKL